MMGVLLLLTLGILIYAVPRLAFFFEHLRPLYDWEVQDLAEMRRQRRISDFYSHDSAEYHVESSLKKNMGADGSFHKMDVGLFTFPAMAAAMMKYKKHEWVMIGFERDRRVTLVWMNKGVNREMVPILLSLGDILALVKKKRFTSVLILHNHPNTNPAIYDCTQPSSADMETARQFGRALNTVGVNLVEYVCERGRAYRYYLSVADSFIPVSKFIEDIKMANGVSGLGNYALHLERLSHSRSSTPR